ncbi:carbohydrate binding family 9 domain-containing protein [bacterium]|nr:carbohydrate binding family 9 domain-containing protein [bacterium]
MRIRILIAFAAVTFFCSIPGLAQETVSTAKKTYRVEAVQDPIKIDGALEEPAWQKPPTFTLEYETNPGDNTAAPVKTEMWITYNHSYLYIAARAHDPEPEKIRARLTDRDRAFQDDFLGVVLDTFNDERRAFEFFVNPFGVQMDLSQSDVTGVEDDSWDAIWDSAGQLTAQGYEVEMAIPFSSLRFPEANSTWGIDALRIYPRDQRYRFGLNQLPRGRNCYLCSESKLQGFAGLKAGKNMELIPTLTGQHLNEEDETDGKVDPGLTVRWGITPGITVNGAANPDFSQVEADAAQLSVNKAFALFYPEKRPFFLEGADYFDTKIQAIYSRNIADPTWGVKLSGKEGKSAFGAIVAQDDLTNFLFPGSQFSSLGSLNQNNTSSILRYRYDLGSGSTVGGLVTSREGEEYHNRVLGVDSLLRWGEEAVRIEFLGSHTEYPDSIQRDFDQPSGSLTGTSMRAVYQHTDRSWMSLAQYQGAGDDFRADLGFIPQVGYHKGYAIYERYWFSDNNEHWWRKLTFGAETTWQYDREGNPLQQQVAPYSYINGPHEFFNVAYLALGPSYFLGRRFDRNFVNEFVEMRPTGSFYVSFETRIGQEIDYDNARQGNILRLIPGVRFDLGRHLRLQLNHNFERLNVDGEPLYHANVTDIRVTYQINTRTMVRAITQYFDISRDPALYTFEVNQKDRNLFNQFLFSYKINPQVVLFLGYSDTYANTVVSNLSQANRTLFFKVGYAFTM